MFDEQGEMHIPYRSGLHNSLLSEVNVSNNLKTPSDPEGVFVNLHIAY